VKVDITLRTLVGPGTPALIRLLSGSTGAARLPTEFPAVGDQRVDTLVELADGRVLHVEWQSDGDASMPRRMLAYWLRISERHPGRTIEQVVVQVGGRTAIPSRLETANLWFRYRVLDSRDLNPAPLLASPASADNIFALLCGRGDLSATVRAILGRLTLLDERERRDALTQLLILAGQRAVTDLVLQEVNAMPLHIDTDKDPYLAELVRKGHLKGLAEGEARGEARALTRALIRTLEKRFGPLDTGTRERILATGADTMETWLDRAIDAPNLAAVLGDGPAN
jgi:hypothetical protein